MKRLFIWDDIFQLFLEDQASSKDIIVDNYEAYIELLKKVHQFDQIFILAELSWDQRSHTQAFAGLQIIRDLRIEHRILCPIFLLSNKEPEFFIHNNQPEYMISRSPGVKVSKIYSEFIIEEEETWPIDEETLDDIAKHLVDDYGIISEVFHDLKNALFNPAAFKEDFQSTYQKKISPLWGRIKNILPLHPEELTKIFDKFHQKLLQSIEQSSLANIPAIIEEADRNINSLIEVKNVITPSYPEVPWKILLIEDEEEMRKHIKKEFKNRNIECLTVGNAKDAFKILEKDKLSNRIVAAIVDYRLYEEDGKNFQRLQGYSIIKKLSTGFPNILSFFAISYLNEKVLLKIQEKYQVHVRINTKDEIQSKEAFDRFYRKVYRNGQSTYDVVCSLPQSKAWKATTSRYKSSLHECYKAHRQSKDYLQAEKIINIKAEEMARELLNAEEYNTDAPAHNFKFRSRLGGIASDIDTINRFRDKLIGRRVIAILHQIGGWDRKRIYYGMQENPVTDMSKIPKGRSATDKGNFSGLINTSLAYQLESHFPENLLVEERAFFNNFKNKWNAEIEKI